MRLVRPTGDSTRPFLSLEPIAVPPHDAAFARSHGIVHQSAMAYWLAGEDRNNRPMAG
jgi:hypothetical protein